MKSSFERAGLDFNVEYVTSVRNWLDSMAKFSSLSGAYKKRKSTDTKEIPHSFTFARRDSPPVSPRIWNVFRYFSNPCKIVVLVIHVL